MQGDRNPGKPSCEAGVSCHVELWPTQQHSVG